MNRHGSRRRRAWLGTAVAALSLGAVAAPAGALELDNTTDTALTIDSNAHWFNDVRPMTHGNYQYMVYWDSEGPNLGDPAPLKVTRRRLSDNDLQSTSFAGRYELRADRDGNPSVTDGHNTVRSGLSRIDGRIHIAWTSHNDELNYVVSSAGCLSQATFSSCTWSSRTVANSGVEADYITYPIFVNDYDGNLFLTFRYGSSETGNQYLDSYNNDGTWTDLGVILHGKAPNAGLYDPDGSGGLAATSDRGPYLWNLRFDRDGRLHMLWNWRENNALFGGSWAQHGLYYAYSDNDGASWKNNAGTAVSDPIVVDDPGLEVVNLPYGTHLGGGGLTLDSRGQPHTVANLSDVVVDDIRDANLRQMHIWRTTNGRWYSSWIEPAGGNTQTILPGDLMFDRGDSAYFIWPRNHLGWSPFNVSPFYQEELRWDLVTWQGGDHLNIQQMTDVTAISTNDDVNTSVSTAGNNQIRVRMRNNTEGDDVIFWWTTDADPTWTSAKSQTWTNALTTNDGSSWRTYTFNMTDADWRGNLRDIEFDPIVGTTAEAGDEIDIDYIRITNSSGTIAKSWEFNEGGEVLAAEAGATDNWSTWNIDTLLPGVSNVWSSSVFPMDEQRYADGTGDSKKVNFTMLEQGNPWYESLTLHEFDISGDTIIKSWNFDVDEQGWSVGGDVSGFGYVSDSGANSVGGTITANDSRIYSANNLGVKVASEKTVQVRLKNTSSATRAKIYFNTDADTSFNETKSKSFTITPNSGYTEYTVDMTGVSGWANNTLRRLRLDPSDDSGVTSGSFKLSRLYIAP